MRGYLLGYLDPYKNYEKKIIEDQSTDDIIGAMLEAHDKYRPEYKKIARYFNDIDKKTIARKIFNFLKESVKYEVEPAYRQTIKSPAAILSQGYGDCKTYSLFAAGVLDALKIPFVFRFASYKMYDQTPGHVFIVVDPGGQDLWLDPVLPSFNQKKKYNYKIDKYPMALYQVSGIEDGQVIGKLNLKDILKKGSQLVLKVAASPSRNAFLLLVKINFSGLATKLKKAWDKNPSGVQNLWEGLGGKTQALKNAWESGSKKKRILGIEDSNEITNEFAKIGEPITAAAGITAAAPILIKVVDFLKKVGIDPEALTQIAKEGLNKKAQELVAQAVNVPVAKALEYDQEAQDLEISDQPDIPGTSVPSSGTGTDMKKYLPFIIGGGALLLVLMISKRNR